MATVSNTSPITTSEDSRNNSETDLNIDKMEDEMHTDTSNWTLAERKRLQIMTNSMWNISKYLVKKLPFIPL